MKGAREERRYKGRGDTGKVLQKQGKGKTKSNKRATGIVFLASKLCRSDPVSVGS